MKIHKWNIIEAKILRRRRALNLKLWMKSIGIVAAVYLYIIFVMFSIIGHMPDKYSAGALAVLFIGFVITTKHDLYPGPA